MDELYDQYKALLFTLAYQLTGSVSDAEDVVQDVFFKAYDVHAERLEEPKAYLCKMVTNRCFNLQKSAQKRREVYVGPWLPEPIQTGSEDSFETTIIRRDLLSYAMLVLLERLTPTERAVFVLREALGFNYPEIAELLGKKEANCRKLLSRARNKMEISEEETVTAKEVDLNWVGQFVTSLQNGNVDHVLTLLTENVMIESDGGGKVTAFKRPIKTREHVAHVLRKFQIYYQSSNELYLEIAPLNGESGIILRSGNEIVAVIFIHFHRGKIANFYFVRNPDKLTQI